MMVWGLVLNLTDFTCPDEFASIFVQESLILTLVAEGNWIRILKKKKNQLRSPIHSGSCGGLRQADSCCGGVFMVSMVLSIHFFPGGVSRKCGI